MPVTKRRIPIALIALIALAAACSNEDLGSLPSPSSAFPSESPDDTSGATGITGANGATLTGGGPPTSPGSPAGDLSDGQARFVLSGDLQIEKSLPVLVTAVFTPPPGGLAMVWTAGGTDASTLGIGGASFTGTRTTSSALTLSLTAQSTGGLWTFLSMNGECDVTIDVAEAGALSGTFRCADLAGSDGVVVGVTASFDATG
jgi:hypothetical protein